MKMKREPLIAASFLMLAITGCDKKIGEAPSNLSASQPNKSAISPQLPADIPLRWASSIEPPQQMSVASESSNFPVTPPIPSQLKAEDYGLVALNDDQLGARFAAISGNEWNQALMEMNKRQTPALVSIMAKNLDEIKGIAVVSGEAMYAPELRYPVARVLMECGEKPIADLITVCTSENFSFKKRILAARVLRHLGASGHQAADAERIRSTLPSSAELSAFNDLWAVAQNDLRVAAVLGDQ